MALSIGFKNMAVAFCISLVEWCKMKIRENHKILTKYLDDFLKKFSCKERIVCGGIVKSRGYELLQTQMSH